MFVLNPSHFQLDPRLSCDINFELDLVHPILPRGSWWCVPGYLLQMYEYFRTWAGCSVSFFGVSKLKLVFQGVLLENQYSGQGYLIRKVWLVWREFQKVHRLFLELISYPPPSIPGLPPTYIYIGFWNCKLETYSYMTEQL